MADGASEEIEPSLGRRESHVTDEPPGIETTFDYLDMIENLQFSLDTPAVEKLCEYFNMTSSLEKIKASDNPQHHFLLECRRECIITKKDTTKLLEALRETGLSNLQRIIEDYNHISKLPDVHVTVNNDNPTIAFSSFKTFMLSRKRALKSIFRRDQGIHFVDCKEGSFVICLKVSSVEELDKLKAYIESRELLRRFMAVYESEISDTERKDFQSESSSIKLSYDTEEFENAKQQLTTNNASFRRKIAITKSVTQTRTETTILQEEMEGFHPPSVVQSVSEEDNEDSEENFLEYLDEVGLNEYFPRKLTMKRATEVRLFPSDDSQIKTKDLPFLFISKLTSLDCRVTWKENLHIEGSARDFIYAILHCSDNHLRQHLLEKFASCQFALPVLLPGVRDDAKPELLTWALSRVVKKWKENKTSLASDKRVVSEPVFTTAFIRFGDIPISKSSVLNNVIGRAQGNETFRYFLSYEDEREFVYHCCGSVEAQWYLPTYGRKEDLLKEVTLLLNLRGDSTEFTTESEFMCRIANAIFIFVDKHNYESYKTAIHGIKTKFQNVFVIYLIEQKGKTNRQRRRQQFNSNVKTLNFDDSVDFGVERHETELAKIICEKIVQYFKYTSRQDYHSIEDWQTRSSNDITVDLDNYSYKIAKQLLQSSFPNHEFIEEVKKSYLQLQIEWVKWVEADKKKLCAGLQTVANQFEAKEKTKRGIRRIQREKGLSPKMSFFWEKLQRVIINENDLLHYFMSFFQTHIDMMVAREIPPIVEKIVVLNTSLQKLKSATKQASSSVLRNEIKELQKQLLQQSEEVNAKNISCGHFISELGQWYEANMEDENVRDRNELLVKMASSLLLAGYPLELLDGENAYIPIKWISGVLKNLANTLNNPKIFVLSIIGTQSNGKSTLLNSLFGARFPVRAGRCTRGFYLQLIDVNAAFHKQFGFQYLLIIDTEGLHSPERTVLNDHTFDNSIATLAMCIGDLTLLNIGQETIGPDMIGILQIVVHALIRMKKVELVSNCRIIQQRVSDIAAAANNKTNMTKIKDALNKVTRIAAAEEKVDHIQDFSDVFPLAEEDDLQFFPCLWMGLMSPPNFGYSDKIHALKEAIFKPNVNQPVIPPQFTMSKFVQRLEDVWDAVKSEDFVFNFQNSFDVFSNQSFRLEHNKLIGKMRTEIFQWELNNGRNITNVTKNNFYRRLEIEITDKCVAVNKKIDEYVKDHSDEEEVKRRQESIKNETIEIGKDIERGIKQNKEIQLKNEDDKKGLPNFIKTAKQELKIAAKEAAKQLKDTNTLSYWQENHGELDRQFDLLWDKKVKQLKKEFQKSKITEEYIENACDESLRKLFLNTEHSKAFIDEMLTDINKFVWKWRDNLNRFGRNFSGSKDGQDKVPNVVFGILNRHKSDLTSQAKVTPFQQSRVDIILQEVYNALKAGKVNSETLVSTLRGIQNEVCKVCKDCQKRYESHNSLQIMFENEKHCLKDEFKSYVDETIKIGAAVKRSYSECVTVLRNVTLNAFNVKLLAHMRDDDCYNDKQRMLGRILEELCQEKDPKLYYDFIEDSDQFVSNWLSRKVLTEITARSQYWVKDVVDPNISEILDNVESALRKTEHELTERGGKHTTFREWENTFLKNDYILEYGMNIKFSVEDFNLSDIEEFTNTLYNMFSSHLKADITKEWDLDKLSDPSVASQLYSEMRDVTRDILDHLGTCKEVCPFCKVPCHLQIRGEHQHKAIFHYSQGVAGYRDRDSEELVCEPCTMLVASNCRYRCRVGPPEEYRPYKDYAEDYPSWDITPIQGEAPIIYWKWVLQTFNNYFAELYKAKPAELPKEWGTVSYEDALNSVRVDYHLTEQ